MDQRKMLEMAAKAAGYHIEWLLCDEGEVAFLDGEQWKPHINKAAFYDLADAIGAIVDFEMMRVTTAKRGFSGYEHEYAHNHNKDIKHTLVALAARIGEAMP